MRNWITLIENTIPSFVEHVTDDLLDEMLTTGKWVDHGGDISDQWDGGCFDYQIENIYPDLIGKPFEEVRHLPEFREALRLVVLQSAEQQYNDLVNGSTYDKLPPLGPNSLLYRGITLAGGIGTTTGVYWSQDKSQSVGRFIDEDVGGWLFVAEVKDVTIDWEATIRSRLDLSNGQDEKEIQLKKGSPVRCRVFRVKFDGGRPTLTLGTYSYLKA